VDSRRPVGARRAAGVLEDAFHLGVELHPPALAGGGAKCCRFLGLSESWFYKWHDRPPPPLEPEPSLKDLVAALVAPVRSGLVLTRATLAAVGRTVGAGTRQGERRFMLQSLLSQQPARTIAALSSHAEDWARSYASWGPGLPGLPSGGPIAPLTPDESWPRAAPGPSDREQPGAVGRKARCERMRS